MSKKLNNLNFILKRSCYKNRPVFTFILTLIQYVTLVCFTFAKRKKNAR